MINRYTFHKEVITCACETSDGSLFVTGSSDKSKFLINNKWIFFNIRFF